MDRLCFPKMATTIYLISHMFLEPHYSVTKGGIFVSCLGDLYNCLDSLRIAEVILCDFNEWVIEMSWTSLLFSWDYNSWNPAAIPQRNPSKPYRCPSQKGPGSQLQPWPRPQSIASTNLAAMRVSHLQSRSPSFPLNLLSWSQVKQRGVVPLSPTQMADSWTT